MKGKRIFFLAGLVFVFLFCFSIKISIIRYEREEKEKIVESTKEEYSFFLERNILEDAGPEKRVFNQVNIEETKNETINFEVFTKSLFKDTYIAKNTAEKLNKVIEDEKEKYDCEELKRWKDFSVEEIIADERYDLGTLFDLFESHDFIENIDEEITKREEYLRQLDELETDLQYFFANYDKYYIKNDVYISKNDDVISHLNEFSKKYGLDIKTKKEVVIAPSVSNPNGVPILCYHGVLDVPWGITNLFVRVSAFEEQMKYLSENGYTPIFASEIANARSYNKPVIITFDDGYKDVYTNAFPILKKYNIKANVYMISGWIGGDVYMSNEMTKEMSASPLIEIGSHTVSHRALATLSNEDIEMELSNSKASLEELTGKKVKVIAYPTGSFDNRVISVARNYYDYALSTIVGKEEPAYLNKYSLRRLYVYRHYTLEQFKALL